MGRLITINTGSSGNCYLLQCGDEILVLDCGVRFIAVKKALKFNIRGIVGAVCTHSHGDHAKYISEYEASGISVWKPYEDEKLIQTRQMCGFTVRSFDCVHNVPCVGYLIEHQKDNLKLLYATDTEYIRYSFSGLTAMLIEMNYSDEYIDKNAFKYFHSKTGHLEKQTTIECIKSNMGHKLKNVILCHLSADGADPIEFKASVKQVVGNRVNVAVAEKGSIVDLL